MAAKPQTRPELPEGLTEPLNRFREAYNAGNATKLAACFETDATFTNIAAGQAFGRTSIEAMHAEAFATALWNTQIEFVEVKARVLRYDIALAQLAWSVTARDTIDGTSPGARGGIMLMVLRRSSGEHWSIAAAQNTQTAKPPASRA